MGFVTLLNKKNDTRSSLGLKDIFDGDIESSQARDQLTLGHLLLTAKNIALKQDLEEGFRVVINNGPNGGETVPHLHVHLLGGRKLSWPPG